MKHVVIIFAGQYWFKILRDPKFREKPGSGLEKKFQHQNGELRGTNITRFYGKINNHLLLTTWEMTNIVDYNVPHASADILLDLSLWDQTLVENLRFFLTSILNSFTDQNSWFINEQNDWGRLKKTLFFISGIHFSLSTVSDYRSVILTRMRPPSKLKFLENRLRYLENRWWHECLLQN